MFKACLKSFLLTFLLSFSFAAVPDWDCDDDGVLGNYNDYQNNGSVTAAVFVDGANIVSEGDLFAAFVNDEQRGAGALTEVPFGPYAGTSQFLTLIYSNAASGETISYKYYDSETDTIYDITETTPWVSDMIEGSVTAPVILNTSGVTSDCYDDCAGTNHGDCSSAEVCEDDDVATSAFGGCAGAVAALGCDFVFGGSTIGELCPESCEECPEVEVCEDDNDATTAFGGCVAAVAALGCDFNFGGSLISELCPDTCGECGDSCDSGIYDCAGVCDGTSIEDCAGVCNGTAVVDECGTCDSDESNDCVQDCNGDWGGTAVEDECGICGGDGSSCGDCSDDDVATSAFGGCAGAVAALGCDFVFGGSTIGELCPETCDSCPEECVDDDVATSAFGGCTGAVSALGCDFVFGGSTIGELCPDSCDECGDSSGEALC